VVWVARVPLGVLASLRHGWPDAAMKLTVTPRADVLTQRDIGFPVAEWRQARRASSER
jgi:hypothetical protein